MSIDNELLKDKYSKIVQNIYKQNKIKLLYLKIFAIYKKYYPKLFGSPKSKRLTIWEEAAGYTESSRLRSFQNQIGYFIEEVFDTSSKYNNLPVNGAKGGNDGDSEDCLFEVKSRFNTMKGSQAYDEIKTKLEYAIKVNKDFKLLVLVDKGNPRKIPLHKGQALNKIKGIDGYDESKHLWVSSDEIFKYLFQSNSDKIVSYILDLLKHTNPN